MTIKIICFESVDGCGKSSIIKAVNKKLKYKYICIDRFLGSSFCYNRHNESEILQADSDLANISSKNAKFYLIYLFCSDRKELIKRLREKKDDDKIKNIDRNIKRYEDYLEKTYLDFITIDTSKNNIDKCVKKIIKFVEKDNYE